MSDCLVYNDKFVFGEKICRLLHVSSAYATIIDVNCATASPFKVPFAEIRELPVLSDEKGPNIRRVSAAEQSHAEFMYDAISDLASELPDMTDKSYRARRVNEVAALVGLTRQTIYKNLRRYWQGGQSVQALYPEFRKCGRVRIGRIDPSALANRNEVNLTDVSTATKNPTLDPPPHVYTLRERDLLAIQQALDKHYMKRGGQTLVETVKRLHDVHYSSLNENGIPIPLPEGLCPSYFQVRRRLHALYNAEDIARARGGSKHFESNLSNKVGSVSDVSLGPGEVYEIDAYRCDIESTDDERLRNAGRPILYILKDRNTTLRVGMYIGFGEPCWLHVVLTILSVLEDKEALCNRLGLHYRKEDWPAHGLLPSRIVGDRGEMASEMSVPLVNELKVAVTLLPGGRPDHKPGIETEFFTTKLFFQTLELGYVDNSDSSYASTVAKKSAAFTIDELEKILWHRLIVANNKAMRRFKRTKDEILSSVMPTPIEIWRFRHRKNPSFVKRFELNDAKVRLLPPGTVSVTLEGFVFKGLHYSNPEAIQRGLFNRSKPRQNADCTFDPRNLNTIWVRYDDMIFESSLTSRSEAYRDLSLAEVREIQAEEKKMALEAAQHNRAIDATLRASAAALRVKAKSEQKANQSAMGKLSNSQKISDSKERGAAIQRGRSASQIEIENAHPVAQGIKGSPSPRVSSLQEAPSTTVKTRTSLLDSIVSKARGGNN